MDIDECDAVYISIDELIIHNQEVNKDNIHELISEISKKDVKTLSGNINLSDTSYITFIKNEKIAVIELLETIKTLKNE